MGRSCGRVAVAVGVAALAVMWEVVVGHAQGWERTRGIEVKPNNSFGGVELALRLETLASEGRARAPGRPGAAVSVGNLVVLCFSTSVDGYVALWNHDAEGRVPTRIYPNELDEETAGQRAVRVVGGEETCIGGVEDSFKLRVRRPLGEASVYMHYTRVATEQFDESDFP